MKLALYITCACLLFVQFTSIAQNVEKLTQQLKTVKSDTTKLRLLVELADACEINEIEQFANKAIELSDKLLQQKKYNKNEILIYKATAINNLAFLNHTLSKSDKAVLEYQRSLKIFEEVNDTNGIIMACNNNSIRYAKRIQDALLTSQNYIERNIKRLKKS